MKVKEESEKVGLKLNTQKTKIMASGPITSWQIGGETVETVSDFIFGGSKIIVDGDCSHEIKRHLLLGRKVMTNLDSIFKSRDITLPTSSHVWMWELDCEESWVLKNWCFWTVVLEKTLESPLDCKEIQSVHSTGDQSWVFFGRTDAKAETPILWPPDAKSWLIGKDSDVGRDWGQDEKGSTEDKMAGWHHRLNGHEFGWTPGIVDGREAWRAAIHGVSKSRTQLSDRTELNWSGFDPHMGQKLILWASLVAQLVKNPAMWETWFQSLGWEDPLEKRTATHSSILAWRIPWTVYTWGCKESDTTEWLSLSEAF